ncbi:hypothetical protein C7999DRAFT_26961 [Corynascus novoguineensis]|uniref:Uncharacterized protein n=1 Tax=Corynascus novoguineensis TaxID=1126955 RepID=A0AAN7D1E2_9PEZI|nr:hypothetical protein C7999DRAFT_26961 [Corynascus novoguineensis]
MQCFLRLLFILSLFSTSALAAPKGDFVHVANETKAAPHSGAGSIKTLNSNSLVARKSTNIPDGDIPEVLPALNRAVHRASLAEGPNYPGDAEFLDNLERLLEIIAAHVKRMRQSKAVLGGANGPTDGAPQRYEAAPSPTLAANSGKTASKALEPVIINYDDMFPDCQSQGELPQRKQGDGTEDGQVNLADGHGNGPQVQYSERGNGGTSFNIICKGISVCNPVTIVNDRGGRRRKLDKLDKAAAKRRKKVEKQRHREGTRRKLTQKLRSKLRPKPKQKDQEIFCLP